MEVRFLNGDERFQARLIATVAFHMRMEDPEKAKQESEQERGGGADHGEENDAPALTKADLGIAVDSAAVALGAEWIERHFTLDRTWKGTDHAASLEPDGVRKLARDCRAVAKALTYKQKDVLDIENVQRNKLKKHQIKWA